MENSVNAIYRKSKVKTSVGAKFSDYITSLIGSWRFIIIQSILLAVWIVINLFGYFNHWDPYPFILLNLVLSFQAAFTAPIIMMSQNRQNDLDRQKAKNDYRINIKAEKEIRSLHKKIDILREKEIKDLMTIIQSLEKK
jgi:uncharacterized membrane protein